MTLQEMVDNKHTVKLRWSEPWTATDQQGNEFTAVVECDDYVARWCRFVKWLGLRGVPSV